MAVIDFRTDPSQYRHWTLRVEAPVAWLTLEVDPNGGLGDYELKQNSYDLLVDIELQDAVQRLRFEHPEVHSVVIRSGRERVFCAGANIRMLGAASHDHKVNFCKCTNETRNHIEQASALSGQKYLCAIDGTAAGGGYELAMACDWIVLVDDGNSAVSLPEVPLLGVLPGTGGLTRLVDKRPVRRDRADVFSTLEEGVKGSRALEWGLVDELVSRTSFDERVQERALEMAAESDRPKDATGVALERIEREITDDRLTYRWVTVSLDRNLGTARFEVRGPEDAPPVDGDALASAGCSAWAIAAARELEDAVLHLRLNETEIGLFLLTTVGDRASAEAWDGFLHDHRDHWLVRETLLLWGRTLKRFDTSARTLFALVEPGSCFVGLLAELAFAADRCYMLEGVFEDADEPAPEAAIVLSENNFGALPMPNGLSRLETRFLRTPQQYTALRELIGESLDAEAANDAGLVTMAMDDIDWEDEIRVAVEERCSFSPDALSGLEANLRFPGPETLETKIFGRLSAWQNWIFQRPNAVGEKGALKRYGSGVRPEFDRRRV